ncbi:MAG: electron transfer flavoprotein subunit alpha/FixB family protein [Bacteroidales bacterium]|nr:electron transfer flavoprotein subunit alpha/FixB family protein [Bacteroidales bacterium]MDZ4203328.1 electron transfer flavoprotein subunit alpha/FixB family protein [Bacteroidales bacterium]
MSILVYTENREGKFKKQSFELVSYAHALAQLAGREVIALSVGEVADDELKQLGEYGASRIIAIDYSGHLESRNFSKLIHHWVGALGPDIVLFADNNTGKSLAGGVAARLKAGVVSGVSGLPISMEPFILSKMVYTGKVNAQIQINTHHKVVLLAGNSFGVHTNPVTSIIEHHNIVAELASPSSELLSTEMQKGKILLSEAEVVVSGGRGMKGPENWGPIEELAGLLGAATACTRPVSDEGWRPHTEHVGQTGKVINPNIYFAFGISGAIQHVAGVSRSKVIVAVNKDPEAAIFSVADYGIVGDVNQALPQLIAAAKTLKDNA